MKSYQNQYSTIRYTLIVIISILNLSSTLGQTCSCNDFLYLNDTGINVVEKFEIDENNPPQEIGSPWLSAAGIVDYPHGIAGDKNGFLYIGEKDDANSEYNIIKFTCDGQKVDADPSDAVIDNFIDGSFSFNHFSYENNLYVQLRTGSTSSNKVEIYDLCDGSYKGCQSCPTGDCPGGLFLWGLTEGTDGYWYGSAYNVNTIYRGLLDPSTYTTGCNETIEVFARASDLGLDASLGTNMAITGIAQDNAGNLYGTWTENYGFSGVSQIWKYTPSGVLTTSVLDPSADSDPTDNLNWSAARGLVWSSQTDRVYVATTDDCIAAFDASDLSYDFNQSVHIEGAYPKGIGILTECCPTVTPLEYNETVCSGGNGERVFLQDIFNCGDGIVCEGMWTETVNTSNGGIAFNDCDLSITVNGDGCAQYTLSNTNTASRCGAFDIVVNVCTEVPTVTLASNEGTCTATNANANDDATIAISGAMNADEANFSAGATYTGAVYGGAGAIDISGGTGLITGLMHNTEYTVRVFNGSNDCFADYTVTTANISCTTSDICDCKEHIYLNEISNNGAVHKFEVSADGTLNEVGAPWFSNNVAGEQLNSPHGLGVDLNGFLYIGETASGDIRKFTCDGAIFPESDFVINDGAYNFVSYKNSLFINHDSDGIEEYNLCDGTLTRIHELDGLTNGQNWGLAIDGSTIYATTNFTNNSTSLVWIFDAETNNPAVPVPIFLQEGAQTAGTLAIGDNFLPRTAIQGIEVDGAGNMYIIQKNVGTEIAGMPSNSARVLKYSPVGILLDMSNWDDAVGSTYPGETDPNNRGYYAATGLVYSETNNLLYIATISPVEDCVALVDTDLNYPGAAVPYTGSGQAKGIAITKECCPTPAYQTLNEMVCAGTNVQYFLNEIFPCDGIICESQWVETANTSGGTITFNNCDLSITVNGISGCAEYNLYSSGEEDGQQCGDFDITMNICITTPPSAPILSVTNNNCPSTTNGSFNVDTPCSGSSVIQEFSIDGGETWVSTLPAWADGVMLMSRCIDDNTGCESVNSNEVTAVLNTCSQTCDCTEMIYLNDVFTNGVHKFSISNTGALVEIGNPWFAGGTISGPHGLGVDINGRLYIGQVDNYNEGLQGDIFQLDCEGTVLDNDYVSLVNDNFGFQLMSQNGILYTANNEDDEIQAFDLCTGDFIGGMTVNGGNTLAWGMYLDEDENQWYMPDRVSGNVYTGTLDVGSFTNPATVTGTVAFDSGVSGIFSDLAGMGITRDNTGNFYMVINTIQGNGATTSIHKYSPTGTLLATVSDNTNVINSSDGQSGFWGARGVVYSTEENKLYVSSHDNCLAVFNTDLVEETSLNVGNPANTSAKGIAIIKECCPTVTPLEYNETVCSEGNGERVFLQDIFNCGDGTVCEGQWLETANTSGGMIEFNSCDLSIIVNGNGCAQYTLSNTNTASRCGAFDIVVNVCTEVPIVTLASNEGTCTGADANDDATISISGAMNADEANFSIGATYTGAAYGGAGAIDISGGTGSITGLIHNTEYTVRVFNGSNDCFADYTVTTPDINCSPVVDCSCTEYIYLNGGGSTGIIHKFTVNGDGSVTELLNAGNPWYPGSGMSELPRPHGLGFDINGFLYIGEHYTDAAWVAPASTNIRRLDCDGNIYSASDFVANPGDGLFNITGYDGFIYSNGDGPNIYKIDPCDGSIVGSVCLNGTGIYDWGFYINQYTGTFYATGGGNRPTASDASSRLFKFDPSDQDFLDNTCYDEFIPVNGVSFGIGNSFLPDEYIGGVTTDLDENIYVVQGHRDEIGTNSALLKYSPTGVLLAMSAIDAVDGDGGYNQMAGVVYSEVHDRLYTSSLSPDEDCLYSFSSDLSNSRAEFGPDPSGFGGKGLALKVECCPTRTPLEYNEVICSQGSGENIFLQEIFSCGEGTICEGQWLETVNTSNGMITFNDCDLSITVNGSGCAQYTLSNTNAASRCGVFDIIVNVCTEVPMVTLASNEGTCTGTTPNNNATIDISGVMNADEANFSAGSTYTGAAYGGAGAVDISGGSGFIMNLIHNTEYTIRVFNGSNDCFADYIVTTSNISCVAACSESEDFVYNCAAGPDGCNVEVESYIVNVPRDPSNGNRPLTPFVYNIPNSPTSGQFQVIARYRTRAGSTAEANGVNFNGIAGTPFNLMYGSNTTYATNFETTLTSGNVSTITLDIDSDPVGADNLPGLEIIVFKCTTGPANTYSGVYPNEFVWINAPDEQSNPKCETRTVCLPTGSCTVARDITLRTTIFNVHQDHTCERELTMIYNPDDGSPSYFVETPPENNSILEHVVNVSAAASSIEISLCTWDNNNNPDPNWNTTCDQGVSTGWANTIVTDACICPATTACPDLNLMVSDPEICEEQELGIEVLNSEIGVQYQLQDATDNSDVGSPMVGNGSTIVLSVPTALSAGSYTYNVVATNSTTNCMVTLIDQAVVIVDECDFPEEPPVGCEGFDPCHVISADLYLGSGSTADTGSGTSDDNDGVIFPNDIQPSGTINLPVTIFNNTGNDAYLTAWIDWNGDGDFEDAGEQIANETYPFATNNGSFIDYIEVMVPSDAVQDALTYAIFRLSTDDVAILSVCSSTVGCAIDGEVEVYSFTATCQPDVCVPPTIRIDE